MNLEILIWVGVFVYIVWLNFQLSDIHAHVTRIEAMLLDNEEWPLE